MKRLILSFFFIAALGANLFAQFEKGNHAINVGLGVGDVALGGSGYRFVMPSITVSYEYGVAEIPMGSELTGVVGVGGIAGFGMSKYKYKYWEDLSYLYTYYMIAARGNYHFIFMDKLDPYVGIWVGYLGVSGKWKGNAVHPNDWNSRSGGVRGGAYVGSRYYFTDNIAVFAELGYSFSIFTVGATFKF